MGDYDDDERPSWREIDKKRDRSSHVSQEKREKKEAPKDRWNVGRHKKALDQLFKGDKGTIDHEKLHSKVHKTYGTSTFLPTVEKYLDKYGPPDDTSTLLLFLDSKDVDVMLVTMEKLKAVYPGASPREKEDMRRKLSIVALTDRSQDLREAAENALESIKGEGE